MTIWLIHLILMLPYQESMPLSLQCDRQKLRGKCPLEQLLSIRLWWYNGAVYQCTVIPGRHTPDNELSIVSGAVFHPSILLKPSAAH